MRRLPRQRAALCAVRQAGVLCRVPPCCVATISPGCSTPAARLCAVGVNGASAPPGVPHNRPFVWQDAASGASLLAMVHPGGYSGTPVDSPEECVQAAGLHHALCFAWRNGNTGAPSAEEVLDIHARVRAGFPGARVAAAGLDAFVEELAAAAPRLDLPVVTGEIGDTWIYGIASDPAKLSGARRGRLLCGALHVSTWAHGDARGPPPVSHLWMSCCPPTCPVRLRCRVPRPAAHAQRQPRAVRR